MCRNFHLIGEIIVVEKQQRHVSTVQISGQNFNSILFGSQMKCPLRVRKSYNN